MQKYRGEYKKICWLYLKGQTLRELAEQFSRSHEGIRLILKRGQVDLRQKSKGMKWKR